MKRMHNKTEQLLFFWLRFRQRSMYEAYLTTSDVMHAVSGGPNKSFHDITVLRKICNHPNLVCRAEGALYKPFLQNGHIDKNGADSSSLSEEDCEFEHKYVGGAPGGGDNNNVVSRSGKLEVLANIMPLWKRQSQCVPIVNQWNNMLDIVERFFRLRRP